MKSSIVKSFEKETVKPSLAETLAWAKQKVDAQEISGKLREKQIER